MAHSKISVFIFCLLGMQTLVFGQTQPPNDECSNAETVYIGSFEFDTSGGATPSSGTPDEANCSYLNWENSPDVWFSFIPTTTGDHTFTTCDIDSYDTSMVLYENSCTVQVACNGDGSGGSGCQAYYSLIEYSCIAGAEYIIRLGGWNGDTGIGTLTIDGPGSNPSIWYVNKDSQGQGTGTSWSNAFLDLQDALDVAVSRDQIWIARGIYTPSDTNGSNDSREATYRLTAGVEIYGGFFGNETDVEERDPWVHVVKLSGDLLGDDDGSGDSSENAYHVVLADNLTGEAPILDSLHITSGNADGGATFESGGGIKILNYQVGSTAYPILSRVRIASNKAQQGGAISVGNQYGGIVLANCIIANNTAASRGGAVENNGSSYVENCLIVGNSSGLAGGVVYNNGGQLNVVNSTIVQNKSGFIGGIYSNNGVVWASNNILWGNTDINGNNGSNVQVYLASGASWVGNYNCIQEYDGNLGGVGNITSNPRFLNEFGSDREPATGDENYRLIQQSPCIDAADNTATSLITDLDGNDRILDDPYSPDTGYSDTGGGPFVDMGAFEHLHGSNEVRMWDPTANSDFTDYRNWLPKGSPESNANVMFNGSGFNYVTVDQNVSVNSLIVTQGEFTIQFGGNSMSLLGTTRPLNVDLFDNGSAVLFKGPGTLSSQNPISLNDGADVRFSNGLNLYVEAMWLGDGTIFSYDGTMTGNLTNEGSLIMPGGNGVGRFDIIGTLTNQGQGSSTGRLVGSIAFDIAGRVQGESYDHLSVSGGVDLSTAIDLRWNRVFTPSEFDSFNIIDAGASNGLPTVIYNSGLPSTLKCRWSNPTSGVRSSHEVVLETTGPILFETEFTHNLNISSAPNELVVANLDGVNGLDVAVIVPAVGGGNGTVVILLNNGVTGDVWQGFSQQDAITVGIEPVDIVAMNIDGSKDGAPDDLIVANYNSGNVSILTNDGSASFTVTSELTEWAPRYITIANFVESGNGLDDIAVACDTFQMSILKNVTSLVGSTFDPLTPTNILSPGDIDPGDINNDKDIDYVILGDSSDSISIVGGNGLGTFGGAPQLATSNTSTLLTGSNAAELAFAQLNDDGFLDAITVNEDGGSISILLGDGEVLGNASTVSVGTSPQSITVSDFDDDGDDDFVISVIGGVSGSRELVIIRNDSDATVILAAGDAAGSGSEPIHVEHGDFDGDGLEDIVAIIDLDPLTGNNSPGIGVYLNTTAVVANCPADGNGSGTVDVTDLLGLISVWGTDDATYDFDVSGTVDVGDLLALIAAWGEC